MQDIGDILSKRDFDIPREVRAIQEYVRRNYDSDIHVTMQPHSITVVSPSAGLIGSLRLNIAALQKAAGTEKRLVLRIGTR